MDVLVVGGGGAGGAGSGTVGGGGGGAGGFIEELGFTVTPAQGIAVQIGAGGAGGAGRGGSGGSSQFGTLNAVGGGGGGGVGNLTPLTGGSGGGGASTTNTATGGAAGTAGQGNSGGASVPDQGNQAGRRAGGGGGGAAASGADGTRSGNNGIGGAGGAGSASDLSGTSLIYAGGGGGGGGNTGGAGGSAVGGAGTTTTGQNAPVANRGGGGGGGANGNGGSGSAGIVIVRYIAPTMELTQEPDQSAEPGMPFSQPFQVTYLQNATGVNNVEVTAEIASGPVGATLLNNTATTDGSGVATFTSLAIDGDPGDYVIRFTVAGSDAELISNTVTIADAVLQELEITRQPAEAQNGFVIGGASDFIIVEAVDGDLVPANNLQITASIFSGTGSLTGTTQVNTDVNGVAEFDNLILTGGSGSIVIEFTASGWEPVQTDPIDVVMPQLAIEQAPPASIVLDEVFPDPVQIEVLNIYGAPVSGIDVTVAVNAPDPGDPELDGTLTRTSDVNGIVEFDDLSFTTNTGTVSLIFSDPSGQWDPVISAPITVTAAPLDELTIEPPLPSTTAQSGVPLQVQPTIGAFEDNDPGQPVQNVEITATIITGDGTLANATATTGVNGLAVFSGLTINDGEPGTFVLRFSADDWEPVDSAEITLSEPLLIIQTQPGGPVQSEELLSPQPVILVQNVYGVEVEDVPVTVIIASGEPGASLQGITTVDSDSSGLATFTNLAINGDPGDYTLEFSAPTWTSVVSATVTVLGPDMLAIETEPSTIAQSGIPLQTQPVIEAIDNLGAPVSGLLVTATILSGGGTLDNATATTNVDGLAIFEDLTINGGPGVREIRFSATDWEPVDFSPIDVQVPELEIDTQPSSTAFSGIAFDVQPVIRVLDVYGEPVENVEVTAAIEDGSGSLGGTVTATTSSAGLATYTNLAITGTGTFTLGFSATGWDPVISGTIDVTAPPGACAFQGGLIGSQRVELLGCTEVGNSGVSSITVPVPPGTVADDLLVAVVTNNGGNTQPAILAGWNRIGNDGQTGGANAGRQHMSVYTRVADGSEPADYTFTLGDDADSYAFMMRFGGASGTVLTSGATAGSGTNATAPAETVNEPDSLVVRFAGVNGSGSMTVNPATIISGHRNITQNNQGVAFGAGAYLNQESTGSTGTANFTNTDVNWVTQTIVIEPAPITTFFEIDHAALYALCTESTEVTITVRDTMGDIVDDFEGTVTISNSGGFGNYSVNTGAGAFDNLTANNGVAEYTFVSADNGVVVLDFSADPGNNETITFDANAGMIGTENYALEMQVGDCSFTISHEGQGGVCAATPVTFAVLGPDLSPVTNYVGDVTINSTQGTGNWSNIFGANGSFSNGSSGDGEATYSFVLADEGEVTLGFTASSGTYDFTISSDEGDVPATSSNDGDLVHSACAFRLFHSESASVCIPEEITIEVVNATGARVTGYVGNVSMSTAGVTGGNWAKTPDPADAFGILTQGVPNTGAATYGFVVADEGIIVLEFRGTTAETVNFNLAAAAVAQPSGAFDPDLVIGACTFEITHSGSSDLCSIEEVTITLRDADNNPAENYTGTINLSTSTGFGTWFELSSGSEGTLNDPVPEDGNATYTFVAADNGSVVLGFGHSSATGNVALSATDGINQSTSTPANLNIASCTFEVSIGGNITACEIGEVTLTVRNSLGDIAEDFSGIVSLSTSTNDGRWFPGDSQGSLTNNEDYNGIGTYQFSPDDNGVVTFDFVNLVAQNVQFQAVSGQITVDPDFNPSMTVSSCLPGLVGDAQCTNPRADGGDGRTTTLSIPERNEIAEQRGRMVLLVTAEVGNPQGLGDNGVTAPTNIVAAEFDGVPMTLIRREVNASGEEIISEMWGILDEDLPENAGTYTGGVTDGGSGNMAICLLAVDQVQQMFPLYNTGNPTAGPVNSSQKVVGENALLATTTISTQTNNALVVGITANDYVLTGLGFLQPQPSLFMEHIFGGGDGTPVANPAGSRVLDTDDVFTGRFGGAAGRQAGVGVANVSQNITSTADPESPLLPQINTHIVAAFSPLVSGVPLADDYDPVVLYETFAGNMSYIAIGNSLRNRPSTVELTVDPVVDCSFDFDGTSAQLTMPPGSSVVAAYLYWGGSGSPQHADAEVSFGLDGSEVPISADRIFSTTGLTPQNVDFFSGYKNVTELVTGNGLYTLTDLVVQTGAPWSQNGTCAGGWALIVIYENMNERLRVLNLFHGLQPFQNSSFTLVPRNFRMSERDGEVRGEGLLPSGQITHVTMEGDEQPLPETVPDPPLEGLGIQTAPDSTEFTFITSVYNPEGNEFNSTVTRPIYELLFDPLTGNEFWEWATTAGEHGDGYELDFPCDEDYETEYFNQWGVEDVCENENRIGTTWGWDVDTHFMDQDLLWEFGAPGDEAERITTQYASGQDLVVLLSEVISVTNFPVADIEVFKTQVGANFKVNSPGTYLIEVVNNGNGSVVDGEATGVITVADRLPTGMTFAELTDVFGTGWVCEVELNPGRFTCEYDIGANEPGGELPPGESLPLITVNVQVGGPPAHFPFLNNNARNVARVIHTGGECDDSVAVGFLPTEDDCLRSPQFDNVFDLEGGSVDANNLTAKSETNNNISGVNTNVRGVETDLQMHKAAVDEFETGQEAQYILTITNNGPDVTTAPFTVTDGEPDGVEFTGASGAGFTCSTISPVLECTHDDPLPVGHSRELVINLNVLGTPGFNVTNTALVEPGPYNFDTNPSNNSYTVVTTIVGPPVASQERFLMSLSVPGDLDSRTSIGSNGLDFNSHELFIYDPATDLAEPFFDPNALDDSDVTDINAAHLMRNGHIVFSVDADSNIGTLEFGPSDLVIHDPILAIIDQPAATTMFLQGSCIFEDHEDVNINGVYVRGDGQILFTTSTGGETVDGLVFGPGDIVALDADPLPCPGAPTASLLLDGSFYLEAVDESDVDIDGFYLRVDPDDPYAEIEVYILTADNEQVWNAQELGDFEPEFGTLFTRDDVTELNLIDETTQNLFLGDVELGVFETADPAERDELRIDSLHVVEDGYIGFFRIREVATEAQGVCEPVIIRIDKLRGLTTTTDTAYVGSVRIRARDISDNSLVGTWVKNDANGDLQILGDGDAIYTFVESDNGEIRLGLDTDDAVTVNVDVTNGITRERTGPSFDPNVIFGVDIQQIAWKDDFASGGFSGRTDDSINWPGPWQLNDNDFISIQNERMRMRSPSSAASTSAARSVDLTEISMLPDTDINFSFNFWRSGTWSSGDIVHIEARVRDPDTQDWGGWELLGDITSSSSTQNVRNYELTSVLGPDALESEFQVRYRIHSGLLLSSTFVEFDNIEIQTETDDCDIAPGGALDHYSIGFVPGDDDITTPFMGNPACVGTPVFVRAHDGLHELISPDGTETITLSTASGRGYWSALLSGGGLFSPSVADNGVAEYTFSGDEDTVAFLLNYPVPAGQTATVNISVSGSPSGTEDEENRPLLVPSAGFRFLSEARDDAITPVLTQIAGKPSGTAPREEMLSIQAVRSGEDDPLVCEPLFTDERTLFVDFAAERIDPPEYPHPDPAELFEIRSAAPGADWEAISLVNNGLVEVAAQTPIELFFEDTGSGPRAQLEMRYSDVGLMQLHAAFEIPVGFFGAPGDAETPPADPATAPTFEEETMVGSTNAFVVRPYGFAIDFPDGEGGLDRRDNGVAGQSFSADADGSIWAVAGANFDVFVTPMAWQDGDGFDGDLQADANLHNNRPTPSFFYDTAGLAQEYRVQLSVIEDLAEVAAGGLGRVGELGETLLERDDFHGGLIEVSGQLENTSYSEVGVITLRADLVDTANEPVNYFAGSTDPVLDRVRGTVANVGRFIPDRFELTSTQLVPRFHLNDSCVDPSIFTYMGEDFMVSFELTAVNVDDQPTWNYFGDYAKLFMDLQLYLADINTEDDVNEYLGRLIVHEPTDVDPMDFSEEWLEGQIGIERLMQIRRLQYDEGDPDANLVDGPYGFISVAARPTDMDGVELVPYTSTDLGDLAIYTDIAEVVDVPGEGLPGGYEEFLELVTEEIRYGRLVIDNVFGPETEPMQLLFRVEYFDGSRFITNVDDSCTIIQSERIVFHDIGGGLDESDMDTSASLDFAQFHNGLTQGLVAEDEIEEVIGDAPFVVEVIALPGEEPDSGSIEIELELREPELDPEIRLDLPYLQYRWNEDWDDDPLNPEDYNNYQQNPRALIDFGRFRSHDRVHSIREIYNRPTQ